MDDITKFLSNLTSLYKESQRMVDKAVSEHYDTVLSNVTQHAIPKRHYCSEEYAAETVRWARYIRDDLMILRGNIMDNERSTRGIFYD